MAPAHAGIHAILSVGSNIPAGALAFFTHIAFNTGTRICRMISKIAFSSTEAPMDPVKEEPEGEASSNANGVADCCWSAEDWGETEWGEAEWGEWGGAADGVKNEEEEMVDVKCEDED